MTPQSAQLKWFHVILTTYDAWLPGDPRGFRTRDHKQHIEGDYKRPPIGSYEALHQAAAESLKQPVVTIAVKDRPIAAHALHDRLCEKGARLAILAVAGRHAHLLAKLPKSAARVWVGESKKHVTFTLRERGRSGRLWGERGKFVPIKDRNHQVSVYRYIERHERQGAYVLRGQG
jgi:hypothetical protein